MSGPPHNIFQGNPTVPQATSDIRPQFPSRNQMAGMSPSHQPGIVSNQPFGTGLQSPRPVSPVQQQRQEQQKTPPQVTSQIQQTAQPQPPAAITMQPPGPVVPVIPRIVPTVENSQTNTVSVPTAAALAGQGVQSSSNQFNTASLCKLGQETVQEMVTKMQEYFQHMKVLPPPNGTANGAKLSAQKRNSVQEGIRNIKVLLKRLRVIYDKCNDNSQLQGMEYLHAESQIPLKEEIKKEEENKTSEAYRTATEEYKELVEQVIMKNRHLKEIIDHLRRIVWEINTMLMMRRS